MQKQDRQQQYRNNQNNYKTACNTEKVSSSESICNKCGLAKQHNHKNIEELTRCNKCKVSNKIEGVKLMKNNSLQRLDPLTPSFKTDVTTSTIIYYPIPDIRKNEQKNYQSINSFQKQEYVNQNEKVSFRNQNYNFPYVVQKRIVPQKIIPHYIQKREIPYKVVHEPQFKPKHHIDLNILQESRQSQHIRRNKNHIEIPTFQYIPQTYNDYEFENVRAQSIYCCQECQQTIFRKKGYQMKNKNNLHDLKESGAQFWKGLKKTKKQKKLKHQNFVEDSSASSNSGTYQKRLYRKPDHLKTERVCYEKKIKIRKNSGSSSEYTSYRDNYKQTNQQHRNYQNMKDQQYYRDMINRSIYRHIKNSETRRLQNRPEDIYETSTDYERKKQMRPRFTSLRHYKEIIMNREDQQLKRSQAKNYDLSNRMKGKFKRAKSVEIMLIEERINQLKIENQRLKRFH